MSIELKKQDLSISQNIAQNFSQAYAEADVIVPDTKPDVAKVIQATAMCYVTDKTISGNKILLDGVLNITILYLTEKGLVKSIHTKQGFKHNVDVANLVDNAKLDVQSDVQNVESLILNSRKLNIKALIGINISVSVDNSVSVTTGVDEDSLCHCQQKLKPLAAMCENVVTEQSILVRNTFELSSGKPPIDDILRLDVKVCNKESKIAGNKILAKGNLNISMLYCSDACDGLQTMDTQIPFSEILTLAAGREIDNCSLDYSLADVKWTLQQDLDGENRAVNLEVGLLAKVNACTQINMDLLGDLYSTKENIDLKLKNVAINEVAHRQNAVLNVNEMLSLSPDDAPIEQVYNCFVTPKVGKTTLNGKHVTVEGVLNAMVLYISNSTDNQISTINKEFKFANTFELSDTMKLSQDSAADVNLDVENINYIITGAGEIDLRCMLNISIGVIEKREYSYISDVEEIADEDDGGAKAYRLRIYFVRNGDTPWSIAKKYRMKVDDLLAANGDNIVPGQKLILT
ncbi:MAG: DUF3794 domain-containing protein [Clostridiales bacterium]|jgi:hypothetical protein|nr:DUF3794 domain-containing protein [Clostridiales bacterium]